MDIRFVPTDLQPASSVQEFKLHCAAVEWSLADPIIINSAEDIKSRVDWQGKVEPFRHQVENLMRFCRRLPVTLLADDVGLGKTISAGLILAELMKRNRVKRVFIICPKILIEQWQEELASKFGIASVGLTGSELRGASNRREPVVITTYQSATNYLLKKKANEFDMLILDEAHKVRNLHGSSAGPPKMAKAIYGALESRLFKYVLMLTATPIQNRLWDIYSLVDCLAVARGHRNPLGSASEFNNRFIADGKNKARQLVPENAEEFRRIVGTYMFRTRRMDADLAFPERIVQTYPVHVSRLEQSLQNLIAENLHLFNALNRVNLLVALMSSPQALAAQLENMARSGTGSGSLAREVQDVVRSLQIPAKAQQLVEIANTLRQQRKDWRMVVFTIRKETQRMICQVLESNGITTGTIEGGNAANNQRTIREFREDHPGVHVVVSTDAGAEGVNLQVANVLINYDLPWNPMIVEQRIGRVQRIGSKFQNVIVSNIVHRDSPEHMIVGRLLEKLQVISHTVGDIEAVLEAADDADGKSLQKQICEMVANSLQGQNQEFAARKTLESIQEAKRIIEENQQEMDSTLGRIDGNDETMVAMPKLKSKTPKVPFQEFVKGALSAEGYEILPDNDQIYRAVSPIHGVEKITFDTESVNEIGQSGVFHGRAPTVYAPGKPAFERLLQRWLQRDSLWVQGDSASDVGVSENLEAVAKDWSVTSGGQFQHAEISNEVGKISGVAHCRTRIANALDSYEKIIQVKFRTGAVGAKKLGQPGGDLLSKYRGLDSYIKEAIARDGDIQKFQSYYAHRRERELARSDHGPRREKVLFDFKESLVAELTAAVLQLVDLPVAVVHYTIDGQAYQSNLSFENGRVAKQPDFAKCELTSKEWPVDCLEKSACSGKIGLRHLLGRSAGNGQYALPSEFVTCSVTHEKFLPTEIERCSVSGDPVNLQAMFRSEVSNRWAKQEYASRCEVTDSLVLPEELNESSLSSRLFRSDEAVHLTDDSLAHKSEAEWCTFCDRWFPKGTCTPSTVSGELVSPDRLRLSELSQAVGDESEIVTCADTGQKVLANEVEYCGATGEPVVKGKLSECTKSGQRVRKQLLQPCDETGRLLLSDLMVSCAVTGRKLHPDVTVKSSVSERSCLKGREVRCEVSRRTLLPDEVVRCQDSGRIVDQQLTEICAVSGQTLLRSRMKQSSFSKKWAKPEYIETVDGEHAIRGELSRCDWTNGYFPAEEVGVCKLSRLRFNRKLLSEEGEMIYLRNCLDGEIAGVDFPAVWLFKKFRPSEFSGSSNIKWKSAPDQSVHIVFGKKSFFGFQTKYFAFFVKGSVNSLTPFGKVMWGRRHDNHWFPIDEKGKAIIVESKD